MKEYNLSLMITLVLTCFMMFSAGNALGADNTDKTGTNPINFTYDIKAYTEFSSLEPDGNQNVTTFEFKAPFAGEKWQFKIKIPYSSIDVGAVDDSGFGDLAVRFLTVPHLDMENLFAVAVGLEVFLNSASEDSLGSGAISLGPQVFAVFFNPLGLNGLFAPAYQHKFSVDEDSGRSKIRQGLIDLNLLIMADSKQYWFFADPQIVLDYEENKEYSIIDLEVGMMLDKHFGTSGHSAYLRPSFGIGSDSPLDNSIELGYKVVF